MTAEDKLAYIVNVEIQISIGYNFSIAVNSMCLMLVCHQDSPVRQSRKMLKIPFSHVITQRNRYKAKTVFLMKYLNVGSSTSI